MPTKKPKAPTIAVGTHYRQGDVLVRRVASIPADAKLQPRTGDIILAHGEVTGHAHRVKERQADMYGGGGGFYLKVAAGGATITHEEHATIPLAPGDYRVLRQREYYPNEIRNVAD